MRKRIELGSRVVVNTINQKSNFNGLKGVLTEVNYNRPYPLRVVFDEPVISGGVPFYDMIFHEKEVKLISEGS